MTSTKNNEVQLSYDDMHVYYEYAIQLLKQDLFYPDVIVPVMRGGADFGVKLSHYFQSIVNGPVPELVPITYQSYDKKHNKLQYSLPQLREFKRLLIVDDIADSGKSLTVILETLRRELPDVDIRTAVAITDIKHITNDLVDYYGWIINRSIDTDWYIFPWEKPFGSSNIQ